MLPVQKKSRSHTRSKRAHKALTPPHVVDCPNCNKPKLPHAACDVQRQKGAAAVFVAALTDEKVTLVAMVSEELAKARKLSAGDWVKAIAPLVGGTGGGKPTLAQAGGRDAQGIPDALRQAGEWAKERLA